MNTFQIDPFLRFSNKLLTFHSHCAAREIAKNPLKDVFQVEAAVLGCGSFSRHDDA